METKKKDYDRLLTEKELTEKYLSGELTFTEYSQHWVEENEEEDEEDDDDEIEVNQESEKESTKVTKTRLRRQRNQLPAALVGLMGEANLRYARGDHDTAAKMCYEIIRQVPTAFEPFHTLAQIYEDDPEKSLQFTLIAAHLNPSDASQWIKLAGISKEKGDYRQALTCYTRAINADPKCIHFHELRLELVKTINERKIKLPHISAQACYLRMLRMYPDTEGQTVLTMAKKVAQECHAANDIHRAYQAMDIAYKRFSNLFTFEDLNLFFELLIAQKEFDKCLNIFIYNCGVEIETEVEIITHEDKVEEITNIVNCSIPETLPIDLRTKLNICFIYMKSFHLVDSFIDYLITNIDVEVNGDIYLDVEEVLTSEQCHKKALRLLNILVSSERYSLPAVWLKYAECLNVLKIHSKAIDAYKTVVKLAPQHTDARIKLAELLKKENRLYEALLALEQNEHTDVLGTGVLYERCMILKELKEYEQYLKVGQLLLSRHFFTIRNRDELYAFRIKDTSENLKSIREARGESFEEINPPVFEESSSQLTLEVEWEFLNDLFKVAMDLKKYHVLEKLAFSALGSKRFSEQYKNFLEFICLLACIYNNDNSFAFTMVRDFVVKMPEKISVYNILNLIGQKLNEIRYGKFLMRSVQRLENNFAIKIMYANNSFISSSYKQALKEYIYCFKNEKSSLLALLTGLTLLHMSCQRYSPNKHALVMQCIGFLSVYKKLRSSNGLQEIYYNFGRAYHQIGLLNLAAQYYKNALNINFVPIDDSQVFNLRQEIAFNLYLIYKNDVPEVASMYLQKYIIYQ